MKKKLLSILIPSLLIVSCKNEAIIIGDRQKNEKCNASAGYQWSTIKKDCIRVFEQEIQLRSIQKEPMEKICALIFSNDSNQVEVFLDKTIILTKKSSSEYIDSSKTSSYLLKKTGGKWQVYNDNQLLFTE